MKAIFYILSLLFFLGNSPSFSQFKEEVKTVNGKKEGRYIQYYDRKVLCEGAYKNDKKEGEWKFYHYEGNLFAQGHYSKGQQIGTWKYYKDDHLISIIEKGLPWETDTLQGYYPDGTLAHLKIIDKLNGITNSKRYWENGKLRQELQTRLDKKDGPFRLYNHQGELLLDIEYKNGNLYNIHYSTNDSSQLEVKYAGSLKDGRGIVKIDKVPGNKHSLSFLPFIAYHMDSGRVEGKYLQYDSVGNLFCVGQFKNNFMDGNWIIYNPQGPPHSIIQYTLEDSVKYSSDESVSTDIMDNYRVKDVVSLPSYLTSMNGEFLMYKYLSENIVYPREAKRRNIQGKVYVQFILDEIGKVTQVTALKSPDVSLSKEAVRVVKKMPPWKPAFKNYLPDESFRMVLPITFRLK